jgi:hypothetical protein
MISSPDRRRRIRDEFGRIDQQRTLFASALIEDMRIGNLSQATQQSYINSVIKFSSHFGKSPNRLGVGDVYATTTSNRPEALLAQPVLSPEEIAPPDEGVPIANAVDFRRFEATILAIGRSRLGQRSHSGWLGRRGTRSLLAL